MAIGGSTPGATRAKDGSKGAAGRFTFLVEAARGYLGALWLARDAEDHSDGGIAYVRHVAPLVAANARAAILDGARWSLGGAESDRFQFFEGRASVDLVTPFADGEILRSLLRTAAVKHASVEAAVLLGMVRALVEQLESVHERALSTKSPYGFGGVHPDSIIVDVHGGVQLLDLGAAAAASSREPWKSDPQRIGYSAPEQLESRGVIDARTDVFGIGIFLWEALANRRLFPGNDAKSARERVQKANITRLDATRASASPGISKEIADVVARCLERDPAGRFQSTGELLEALDALEPAPPERVGAWITTLADAAIGKRRQILERAAAGALTGEERLTLPPTSIRPTPRGVSASTSRPPAKTSSLPAPAPRPSSMPAPRPSSAAPARPPSNGAAVTPRSGGTLPGPTPPPPSIRPASLAGAPPPPSARAAAIPSGASSAAPPPPSARAAAHAAIAPPPSARAAAHAAIATPLPSSARSAQHATATPLPPSARSAQRAGATPLPPRPAAVSATATPAPTPPTVATPAPPSTANATTTPLAGMPLPPSEPPAPGPATPPAVAEASAPAPDAPRAESSPANAIDAPARARADSAEAIEPEEDSEESDPGVDDDVEDDESDAPEASVVSKRPPPLPHEAPLPLAGLAGAVGGPSDEPLARPIPTSQLSALTAPQPVALPRSAVVAALVSLIALGAFVLYRHHSHAGANEPRIERTVQTPPVRIEEPLSAVPATPPPPATASVAAEPVHIAPVETPPAAPAETTAPPKSPAAEAAPPKTETAEKPPPKPRTAAAEAPHRPPSHEPTNTGFKPGGI